MPVINKKYHKLPESAIEAKIEGKLYRVDGYFLKESKQSLEEVLRELAEQRAFRELGLPIN